MHLAAAALALVATAWGADPAASPAPTRSVALSRLVLDGRHTPVLLPLPGGFPQLAGDALAGAGVAIDPQGRYQLRPRILSSDLRGRDHAVLVVEWRVFDLVAHQVIYAAQTTGVADADDDAEAARGALAQALAILVARPAFLEALGTAESGPATPTWAGPLAVRRCDAPPRELPRQLPDTLPAVVELTTSAGLGSGVMVSPDGLLLTAAHVVEGAGQVTVRLSSGPALPGTVVRLDHAADVALVSIGGTGFACLPAAASPGLGAEVFAIGNPLGTSLTSSVSRGIVSGLRIEDGVRLVQTDASVNPGNSGGPLVDASGAVVGIVSFKAVGKGIEGVGFAVSIDAALERLAVDLGDHTDPELQAKAGIRGGAVAVRPAVTDAPDPIPPRVPPAPPKTLLVAGSVLAAGGIAGIVGTWRVAAGADAIEPGPWTALQLLNSAAWVGAALGSGSVIAGAALLDGGGGLSVRFDLP